MEGFVGAFSVRWLAPFSELHDLDSIYGTNYSVDHPDSSHRWTRTGRVSSGLAVRLLVHGSVIVFEVRPVVFCAGNSFAVESCNR